MARKNRQYKRLSGLFFSLLDTRSLWQGPDHLLWVETVFWKENYKRFFYSDIQSIVLQRTNTHLIWTALWGGFALISCLIALLGESPSYSSGFFVILFLLASVINLALGPSCSVLLQTAVQTQKLSSLKRVRSAKKAIERIRSLVTVVQGPYQPSQRRPVTTDSANPGTTHGHRVAKTAAQPARRPVADEAYTPLLHRLLYIGLIIIGVMVGVQLMFENLPAALIATFLHTAVQVLAVVALVRWYRSIKGSGIATGNWLALVFVTLCSLVLYGLFMATSILHPTFNYNHWAMFKGIVELQYADHPAALAGNLVYAAGSLFIGIFGMIPLWRQRTLHQAP